MTTPVAVAAVRPPGERDRRILQLAAAGWPYAAIARELGCCEQVVKNRMARLYQQVGADNITHAVAIALRKGWIE